MQYSEQEHTIEERPATRSKRIKEISDKCGAISEVFYDVSFPPERVFEKLVEIGKLAAKDYETAHKDYMQDVVQPRDEIECLIHLAYEIEDPLGAYSTPLRDEAVREELYQIIEQLAAMIERLWTPDLQERIKSYQGPHIEQDVLSFTESYDKLARKIASEVEAGPEGDSQYVTWSSSDTIEIKTTVAIPDDLYVAKSTVYGRRSKLRAELSSPLKKLGWTKVKGDKFARIDHLAHCFNL